MLVAGGFYAAVVRIFHCLVPGCRAGVCRLLELAGFVASIAAGMFAILGICFSSLVEQHARVFLSPWFGELSGQNFINPSTQGKNDTEVRSPRDIEDDVALQD